jgi:hypothetical protein
MTSRSARGDTFSILEVRTWLGSRSQVHDSIMLCVSIAIEEIRYIMAKNVDRNEGVSERQVKIH